MSQPPKDKDLYRPETDNAGAPRAILMITDNDTEDLEFFYPYYRFIEAGFKVDVVTPEGGALKAKHGLGLKETQKLDSMKAEGYELLYIPGGQAPAHLKKNKAVLSLVQAFADRKKPIAAVCHAAASASGSTCD